MDFPYCASNPFCITSISLTKLNGNFVELTPLETIRELEVIVQATNLSYGHFYANHASNYLNLSFQFPGGKEEALNTLKRAINRELALKPEMFRGL